MRIMPSEKMRHAHMWRIRPQQQTDLKKLEEDRSFLILTVWDVHLQHASIQYAVHVAVAVQGTRQTWLKYARIC
jgi:hypothetical protein